MSFNIKQQQQSIEKTYFNIIYELHNSKQTSYIFQPSIWLSINCWQPGNKIPVFIKKNNILHPTGETIQLGTPIQIGFVKKHQYIYKKTQDYSSDIVQMGDAQILPNENIFTKINYKLNQHLKLNNRSRYIRASHVNTLNNIKSLKKCINNKINVGYIHPKLKKNQIPISKSDIKLQYNINVILFIINFQKKYKKYYRNKVIKNILSKYLNFDTIQYILSL